MKVVITDGGRSNYFQKENVRDCVTRAITIATGLDYKKVYDDINELAKHERKGKRKKSISSARNGVYKETYKKYLDSLGWTFVPLMGIGTGCKVHLKEDEIPNGTIICKLSKHLVCVKDKVIYDTFDCSRDGTRCVYGYWIKKELA